MEPEMVKLKNGVEEFGPLVRGTMMSLRTLIETDPVGFYELVSLARDRNHQLFGNAGERLVATALLGSGEGRYALHSSIKNVILSAVEGEGLEMVLGEPVEAAK